MQMDFLPNQQPDVVEYAADGQRERHIIPDGQHDPLGRVVLAVGRGYGHGAGHIKDDGHDKAQRLRFADDLLLEAQTLTGDWRGSVMLSELAEDGQSRN